MSQQSRRGFLAYLGLAGASATAAAAISSQVATKSDEVKELPGYFKHPSEYLAAMLSIGMKPVAMYQPLKDGTIHRMGVSETSPDGDTIARVWGKYHAIQMRAPVMLVDDDGHVRGDWWKWVWQHLYDAGYREDVSPKGYRLRDS